jgi:hypothetical protein
MTPLEELIISIIFQQPHISELDTARAVIKAVKESKDE